MYNEISIVINNERISGWKSFGVQRALDAITGRFELTVVNVDNSITDLIQPQKQCEIFLDDDQILSGTIFKRKRTEVSDKTSLVISGRDVTAALIDCSAIYKNSTWNNKGLIDIVKDICKPFGISVESNIIGKVFIVFSIQAGETAGESIQRACRQKGSFAFTNRFGKLVIQELKISSFERTENKLVRGLNLKSIDEDIDIEERYSEIRIIGQEKGEGREWIKEMLEQRVTAKDESITLYRPHVVITDTTNTLKDLQARANWEIQYRAGKSRSFTTSTAGFRQKGLSKVNNPLWDIGLITTLEHNKWGILEDRLISGVQYSFSDNGSICSQVLNDPKTFVADPLDKTKIEKI